MPLAGRRGASGWAVDLLFRPCVLDALAALRADADHVLQPGGLLLDDVKDALPEGG